METISRIMLCLVCAVSVILFYLLAGLGMASLGWNWWQSILLLIILCTIITLSLVAFMKGLK